MTDAVRTTTLAELRRRAAFRLGDLVQLDATNDGTVSTLIDYLNIPLGNEDLTRRQIAFTDATFTGQQRVITNTNQASHTITFSPVLAGITTAATTTADVFNKRGQGFALSEYKQAALMAADDAFPIFMTIVEGTAAAFDDGTPVITVPSTMARVFRVIYQDTNGDWFSLPKAQSVGYDGWWANTYDSEIVINGFYRIDIDGLSIKIIGYGKEAAMTTDASTTKINPEWLVARMCYHLCFMGLNRDASGTRAQQVIQFQQEAERLRELIRTRFDPESEVVRT